MVEKSKIKGIHSPERQFPHLQILIVNTPAVVTTEVEVGMIGKVQHGGRIRGSHVIDGQSISVVRQRESDSDTDISRIAFFAIRAQKAQRE